MSVAISNLLNSTTKEGKPQRIQGYDDFKKAWTDRCVALFLKYFPKVRSIPNSIQRFIHFHSFCIVVVGE
jgi:hypothetical protein